MVESAFCQIDHDFNGHLALIRQNKNDVTLLTNLEKLLVLLEAEMVRLGSSDELRRKVRGRLTLGFGLQGDLQRN